MGGLRSVASFTAVAVRIDGRTAFPLVIAVLDSTSRTLDCINRILVASGCIFGTTVGIDCAYPVCLHVTRKLGRTICVCLSRYERGRNFRWSCKCQCCKYTYENGERNEFFHCFYPFGAASPQNFGTIGFPTLMMVRMLPLSVTANARCLV
jgi:hypothetical protein